MGSMILLSAGEIDVDWGKNDGFGNHACLFQPGDEALGPYHYVADDHTPIVEQRRCLCRPLGRVAPRLDMLGYTLERCEARLRAWLDDGISDTPVSMEALRDAVHALPWRSPREFVHFDDAIREAYRKALSSRGIDCDDTTLAWEQMLDPYLVLRVLADGPDYLDLPVRWKFADVLEGGWTSEHEVAAGIGLQRRIVLTEGSSDTAILERSLRSLHADIADFFDFIDMKAGNPFPGVGNIVAFCKGLSRIRYQGAMLIVLDNDAAGNAALKEIRALDLSPSVVTTCLPDLPGLAQVATLGPAGQAVEDINGRASAIECFLDFSAVTGTPTVRWTSFERRLNAYQGELIGKEGYATAFHERFGKDPNYDDSKLKLLWHHLIQICTASAPIAQRDE